MYFFIVMYFTFKAVWYRFLTIICQYLDVLSFLGESISGHCMYPFHPLSPMKASENQSFSVVFYGER